ncbi:Chromatin structure-remodeling complex protein SYD [Vitis vinifera]|uniref:Chromatin structure-remodeling complex protein SYD n=1 Tax=Vitis vinifera TaxID=29760 RepID=A0A438KLV9_VITVI|nr:Chromatin structure-remodeling complex protein SYD [Vitis vinifera]
MEEELFGRVGVSLTGCERIFGAGEGVLMRSIFLMRDGLMEVGEFIDEPILWIFLRLGFDVGSIVEKRMALGEPLFLCMEEEETIKPHSPSLCPSSRLMEFGILFVWGRVSDALGTVSSSEDISAKTKSVIELKKLQLLALQRRLRRDFLNDFFKPIAIELDRLKSFKKHRHGRRIKQLEKFEQKMKEERQKRIRERQKEFFSEIEVHKERLDDVFKFKRERWKSFSKYVKEFHKRKERIHREKIDRIQREKINLLKINDVEGYLRMVQDAKSDRVKQLLKETEKYLQKLGSKLQEAKSMTRHFEVDMDENRTANVVEKNETAVDNEDESDQAKHYLESNEKYYLMAHSVS